MLQTLLSIVLLTSLASLAVAVWRLAIGVSVARVSAQVSTTGVIAALVAAVGCGTLAVGSAAMFTPGVGLLRVGLTPKVLENERAARAALALLALGAVMIAVAAARLRTRHSFMYAIAADLSTFRDGIRTDWQRLRTEDESRALLPTLAALIVLGTAARVYLTRYPISYDESTTIVWFASRSPLDILTDYAIPNNHILHTLFVHLSRQLFGASELAGRIPALVSGILLIPITAWIGWKQFGAGVALIVAAIVSSLPPLLEYSAQARGYTLSALLVALAFLSLLYALEKPTRSAWMLYALCTALALFTVPTSLMGLYFIGIWLLCRPGRTWAQLWHSAAWTAGAIVLAVVLYLPAVAYSGWQSLVSNVYVRAIAFGELPRRLAELATVLRDCWAGGLPNWLAGALMLVSVCAVVGRTRGEHRAASFAMGFVGMCIVVLLVNRTVPPERSLVVILPLLACVTAAGLHALLQPLTRRHRLALPVVTVALSGAWMVGLEVRAQSIVARPELVTAPDGSDDRVHCCASGYYSDAEAVAVWARRVTSPTAPVVVHAFDGMGETVRFYLIREQVEITRLHRFDHRAGFAQLVGYDSMFVISRGAPRASEPDAHAAYVLRLALEPVQALFTAHMIGTPFPESALVVLVPRQGMAATIAASGRQINRLDYPR